MDRDHQWLRDEKYGGIETQSYLEDVRRLARGEPLAYVIGSQPFLGLTISLDSSPLIPRPETEWWTSELISSLKETGQGTETKMTGIDLCSGSGAIGCALLANLPQAQVYFGELDPAHEATIVKNIQTNNLDAERAHIGIGDLFAPFASMTFDVIASNPPYIPLSRDLPESVTRYEPSLALRSGHDGLGLIRRIAQELPRRLTKNGVAWIECDSSHTETARALVEKEGLSAKIRTDHYGVPRVLVVSFP